MRPPYRWLEKKQTKPRRNLHILYVADYSFLRGRLRTGFVLSLSLSVHKLRDSPMVPHDVYLTVMTGEYCRAFPLLTLLLLLPSCRRFYSRGGRSWKGGGRREFFILCDGLCAVQTRMRPFWLAMGHVLWVGTGGGVFDAKVTGFGGNARYQGDAPEVITL